MPDGLEGKGPLNGGGCHRIGSVSNHVYGTFTSAKEKIVQAGRHFAASMASTKSMNDAIIQREMVMNKHHRETMTSPDHDQLDDYVIPKKTRS